MTCKSLAAIALGVGLLLMVAGVAVGDELDADAQARYDQAVAAYAAHDYEASIELFRAAYAIDPQPMVLFAWAQAERLNGNCPGAIQLYRRFLEARPTGVQADAARQPLARCERSLASHTEPVAERVPDPPASASAPDPAPVPVPTPAPTPVVSSPPFYKDAHGTTHVATGAVAVAIGVGFLIAAGGSDSAAAAAGTYDDFRALHDQAGTRRTVGAVALAGGLGLATAGVVRWIVHGSHTTREPAVAVGVSDRGRGWTLAVAGRF
jgi:hypothetical protein